MIEERPTITIEEAEAIGKNYFNIIGVFSILSSERDQNFLISTPKGKKYVLKIANGKETLENIELQNKIIKLIKSKKDFNHPNLVKSKTKEIIEYSKDNKKHFVRLVTYIEGITFADYKPKTDDFLYQYGKFLGNLTKSMIKFNEFSESFRQKEFHWDSKYADSVLSKYKHYIKEPTKLATINYFQNLFKNNSEIINNLPQSIIHNDANDYNVIVSYNKDNVSFGIIDFGDMVYSHTLINLAVGIAYAILDNPDPIATISQIVKGYNDVLPLQEQDLQVLFTLVAIRLTVSVCISAYQQTLEPDNAYLVISEKPAWLTLIQLKNLNPDWIECLLHNTLHLEPLEQAKEIKNWLIGNKNSFYPPFVSSEANLEYIDLGITSGLGNPLELNEPETLQKKLYSTLLNKGKTAGILSTGDIRIDYMNSSHKFQSNDFLLYKNYKVALEVVTIDDLELYLPFEGLLFKEILLPNHLYTLIFEHQTPSELKFYSIFSNVSIIDIDTLTQGSYLIQGTKIGIIPRISSTQSFFQFNLICADHLDFLQESYLIRDKNIVDTIFLNPLELFFTHIKVPRSNSRTIEELEALRKNFIGSSLSISYSKHLHIIRGYKQYLYSNDGKIYLDAVNNVPHVGHNNDTVVKALIKQAQVLNTNTRYLHETILEFAQKLTSYLPDKLKVCYFVNSGSEANELALRLAETYTNKKGIAVLNHAYHGNTSKLIDISPYKHNGPGGKGTPDYVLVLDLPDPFRGKYKANDNKAGLKYATDAISEIEKHSDIGTFIFESFPGVAGQIVLAKNYLKEMGDYLHEHNIACIADEVQIGLGRVGSHFWGFEVNEIVPDIVTIGKPLGNSHPLGAVITTKEIADAFNNGMEYFNTFGGNPVSCAIGVAVLEEIEKNNLQKNALEVGTYLLNLLQSLKTDYPLIGDVRGLGLYIGLELVRDRITLEPADWEASYIVERMKEKGVLMSTDGPYHNVLKIKPPLVFTKQNALELFTKLELILQETKLGSSKVHVS